MEHTNCSVLPNVGTRERINGLRKLPKGVKLDRSFSTYIHAKFCADVANYTAKRQETGATFHVSGVEGNYCIIRYENEVVLDTRFVHMT